MSGAALGVVHFLVPEGIDDPGRASGGNVFDRHVRDGLAALRWDVHVWPVDPETPAATDGTLSRLPDGAVVLIDGLVAGRAAVAVEEAAARLRVVVLAHMVRAAFPDADPAAVAGERRALRGARRVIATSEWTRAELVSRGLVPPDRIVVATPGSDDAPIATGTRAGRALLCVGVVAAHKGQDVLVDALSTLAVDPMWTCTIAGSLDASPAYARRVAKLAADAGLGDRFTMTGALAEGRLDDAYRSADLVVAPSRVEAYGMAIAEALRRGIPVVATSVGGIPLTVAARAAVLVPPDRPRELGDALQRWMVDPSLRERMKEKARRGSAGLPRWADTIQRIASTLAEVR